MLKLRAIILVFIVLFTVPFSVSAEEAGETSSGLLPWWGWTIVLFVFTLILGIFAVVAGVGGGVLFVPIVASFFPFHLDFVRGAGLMVALCGALSAGPSLLKNGFASMRLAIPLALFGSIGAIIGAFVGLAVPVYIVKTLLGTAIIGIVLLMLKANKSFFPSINKTDNLGQALGIYGIYYEDSLKKDIKWTVHRTPAGLLIFIVIGFFSGMFGIGAGWANVPALNLLLGAPLKVSVATSGFIITISGSAGSWIYLNSGAVLPLITVPSVAGMMLGARIGASILSKIKPTIVRWAVIILLCIAGLRSLLDGLGIWS